MTPDTQLKEIAQQLLPMFDDRGGEDFYNWLFEEPNRTGSKRLEWLREIIREVADD